MATLLVRHSVQDFGKWKRVFDEHADARKNAGSKGGKLYQASDNPNDVTVVLQWDTIEHARKFAESPDLQSTMQNAGVTGQPQIRFLEREAKLTV